MGYPGDEWRSPYGGGPQDPPPWAGDRPGPGGPPPPAGHDPQRGYPPRADRPNVPWPPPDGQQNPPVPPAQQPPGGQYPHPNPYGGGPPPDPLGGPPPGGPPPYGGPPGGGYGAPPGGGGPKSHRALIIGAVCVAVVVLLGSGAVALSFVLKDDSDPGPKRPPAAASSPGTSSPSPTETDPPAGSPTPSATRTGRWLKIADRSSDPSPLTLDELFAKHTLNRGKKTGQKAERRRYKLVKRAETKRCRSAVTGDKLRAALHAYDCDQLLRATYLRSNGKFVGTVGVANLADSHGAKKAFTSASGGKQYVTPLPGPGKAARVGQGAALGIRQEKGHYLILSWVQYTDGHRPSSAERTKLSQFHEDVVREAISGPLGHRMLIGKPQK